MKRSVTSIIFSGMLLFLSETFLFSAIFQEPMPQDPKTFKTHYFFLKDKFPAPFQEQLKPQDPVSPGLTPSVKVPLTPASVPVVPLPASSVTGATRINACYEKPTLEKVNRLFKKYKDIPGGITLEGKASGLDDIKKVSYDPQKNVFLLDDQCIYENPLSGEETKVLLSAIEKGDLAGVSLGDKDVTYGALEEGSIPCINLKLADHFLGCIVFANEQWVKQHSFPGGYTPKNNSQTGAGYYAAYFNFKDYVFTKKNDKIALEKASLVATVIPLLKSKDRFLPDTWKIMRKMIPEAYEANTQHIIREIGSYEQDSRLQKVLAYGEVTAFARILKEKGISLSGLIA
jgi:hypothetical protein